MPQPQQFGAMEWPDEPGIALFMTELVVADWAATVAWYERTLGLCAIFRDEAHGFVLLGAGATRLALKAAGEGTAASQGVRLVFQVADVDAEHARLAALGVSASPPADHPREPYRETRLADPSGTPITLFSWRT